MNTSQINRYLSLPASILLFLFSVQAIISFFDVQEIEIHDVVAVVKSFFFLLTSVLLLLDFCRVKIFLVEKKIWLLLFSIGFAIKIIF